jgi:membrane associated rhomboid family serine protease
MPFFAGMEIQQYLLYFPAASIIFGLTIAASLLAFRNPQLLRNWMLNPFEFVYGRKYYQVLSSGVIHADLQHLLFNMLSFYFFAFPLEGMMVQAKGPVGHLYFALVYLISMVLADVPTIINHRNNPSYFSLGASGAVTAVIFSFILFDPLTKISLMFIPIGIPAPIFALL